MSLKKLNERDAKAVDALCEHGVNMNATDSQIAVSAVGVSADAIKSASKILQLLDSFRDDDPPDDLVARTLRRIDRGGNYRTLGAESPSTGDKPA